MTDPPAEIGAIARAAAARAAEAELEADAAAAERNLRRKKEAADKAALPFADRGNGEEHGNIDELDLDAARQPQAARGNGGASAVDGADPDRAPTFSDEAIALRFAERHAGDLRFVAKWGKWLSWTGTRWRFDDTLHAFGLVRLLCREVAAGCNKESMARAVASAKTVAAVERLARADPRLAATVDQWDADRWILNTSDGVIDLRTGQRRAHNPADHMTKITAVGPAGECPRFRKFLKEITGGDADLQAYILRVFGYALTGDTTEQAIFFAYGKGANGKSVLLSTVSGILGDYHEAAPMETFVESKTDRHPAELAKLQGARLVTATETEEGRRWSEAKIKQLTGGEKIPARFMGQNFFDFLPQFKLAFSGNHKPSLRSVDEAIRRRMNLIPFTITIPETDRDLQLAKKLKTEWPGILQLLVDACLDWQAEGLRAPKAVKDATAEYLTAEDAITAWIDDKCERDPTWFEGSASLYESFSKWAERAGEPAGSQKRLSQILEDRGFRKEKTREARGFYGLRIKWDNVSRSSSD